MHSLYAGIERRKPSRAHLENLDALVFDMQDIGCRFFTYISTMGLAMEAAEEAGLKFVVLDRPNPIGGLRVDGPLVVGRSAFVAFHDIPVRHGMTVGRDRAPLPDRALPHPRPHRHSPRELAARPPLRSDRAAWIKPSPNMPNLTAATLYPGLGLLEFTNLSVGRGTRLPFELVGAPYISPDELADRLRAARLPGLQFVPVRFTPESSVFKEEPCGGVRILVKDRRKVPSVRLGLVLAQALRSLYPADWDYSKLNILLRHPATANGIVERLPRPDILEAWRRDLRQFAPRRRQHLLYN